MRSLTLFTALVLVTCVAFGQTGSTSLPPTGPKPQVKPYPDCVPGVYGTQVGEIFSKRTNEDRFVHWYCRAADGSITGPFIACVHGSCMPVGSFFEAFDEKRRASDPIAAVQQAWTAQMTPVCDSPTGTMAQVCADVMASRTANWPGGVSQPPAPPASTPAYTYAVKPNGTSTTRPVYLLTNGVRGTTSVGRADVGQPCDLTKPTLASGSDVWASFGPLFESGKVALCAN